MIYRVYRSGPGRKETLMNLRWLYIKFPDGSIEKELQYWNDNTKLWTVVNDVVVNAGDDYRDAMTDPDKY